MGRCIKDAFSRARGWAELIGFILLLSGKPILGRWFPNTSFDEFLWWAGFVVFIVLLLWDVFLRLPFERVKTAETNFSRIVAERDNAVKELRDTESAHANRIAVIQNEARLKVDSADMEAREKIRVTQEQLQIANEKIQNLEAAHLRQWGLSDAMLDSLINKMRPYATDEDQGGLITCVMGDADSLKFAHQLSSAFRVAGWNLPGNGCNQALYTVPITGLFIQISSSEDRPPAMLEFYNFIHSVGIPIVGEVIPEVPKNKFRIVVGSEPPKHL